MAKKVDKVVSNGIKEASRNIIKGTWEVTAGTTPGQLDDKLSRQFIYTNEDYEFDYKLDFGKPTRFVQKREEAFSYARYLADPQYTNWVSINWEWSGTI